MKLTELECRDFRNFEHAEFSPVPGINLITGLNGRGKTNLIESIWMLCGQGSFRTFKPRQTVRFGQPQALIGARFTSAGHSKQIDLEIKNTCRAFLNGIPLDRYSSLGESFAAVIFSPVHIGLVSGGPEQRREFLDTAILSTKPAFNSALLEYNKVLYHRNYLLKKLQTGSNDEYLGMLDAYTERVAKVGARVWAARRRYCIRLAQEAPQLYEGISGGESLELSYESAANEAGCETPAEYALWLFSVLKTNRDTDIAAGFSSAGPHREDFDIRINGCSARNFASQGQMKSTALCLKLAEGRILESSIERKPVFLLDDVMSELDRGRQSYILSSLGENQIFITCCDPAPLKRRLDAAVFTVKNASVTAARPKTCSEKPPAAQTPEKAVRRK